MRLNGQMTPWPSLVAGLLVALVSGPASAKDEEPPQLFCPECSAFRPDRDFAIVIEIWDDSGPFDPKVIYRSPSTGKWRTVPLKAEGDGVTYKAILPRRHLAAEVQYFIEAFDMVGNGPSRCNSSAYPAVALADASARSCDPAMPYDEPAADLAPHEDPGAAPGALPQPALDLPQTWTGHGAKEELRAGPASGGKALAPEEPPESESACDQEVRPYYCEVWVWGVAGGVVVAGLGITLLIALWPEETSDLATLKITGPSPTAVGLFSW